MAAKVDKVGTRSASKGYKMSLQANIKSFKTRAFKRAAAAMCHFKGETARRDRLVVEIALEKLATFADRKGLKTAQFHPERKFRHDLTAIGSGTHWVGMVNQPGEFQKRSIVAAAQPIEERMKREGVKMEVRVVDGGRFGFTGRTPAVLEASFRPSPAATGAAPSALQQG